MGISTSPPVATLAALIVPVSGRLRALIEGALAASLRPLPLPAGSVAEDSAPKAFDIPVAPDEVRRDDVEAPAGAVALLIAAADFAENLPIASVDTDAIAALRAESHFVRAEVVRSHVPAAALPEAVVDTFAPLSASGGRAEIGLRPAHLGKIDLVVAVAPGGIEVTLAPTTPQARSLVADALPMLTAALAEATTRPVICNVAPDLPRHRRSVPAAGADEPTGLIEFSLPIEGPE
jgi:Flagellar hook-length control protein FliK